MNSAGLNARKGLRAALKDFCTDSALPGSPAETNMAAYCSSATNLSLPSALARRPLSWFAYASDASMLSGRVPIERP